MSTKHYIVRRINYHQHKNQTAIVMALWGFYANTIGGTVGLSKSAVYYRCHQAGVRITDYRKGLGPAAQYVLHHIELAAEQAQLKAVLRPLLKAHKE